MQSIEAPVRPEGGQGTLIHLSRLRPARHNPRGKLVAADWADLVPSVREHGVIQPILVRPLDGEDAMEIVAGERRYRAACEAFDGDYEIPYVSRVLSDADALVLATIENLQRERMNPAREAEACQTIVLNLDGDKEEAARQMGWSVETLERRLALMACTQKVRDALVEKRILLGHAELLAAIPPATQDSTLDKVVAQSITVQMLKERLGQFARKLNDAPFDTRECAACPHNSNRQSQLFSEALGEGFCTHPTHFDELVDRHVAGIAADYKDSCPVVRIVKPKDGFVPLPVGADGELGVGYEQYQACKGCANFGCSISAMPGSYGQVAESLCFNAECNSKKIAAHKKALRQAKEAATPAVPNVAPNAGAAKGTAAPGPQKKDTPSNKPPQRVLEYRVEQWRKWAANALMSQPERNQRVLVAVLLSVNQSRLASAEYRDAVAKITGTNVGTNLFEGALKDTDGFDAEHLPTLVQCVSAAAALGIDESNLETLLNYLEVEEAAHFKLNEGFLALYTKSELDSLADELKLRKAMGEGFAKRRDGKKDDFIKALLSVPGFEYAGLVPKVMRYKRKKFPYAARDADPSASEQMTPTEPATA
ncbi:MAG: PRTRC system ParB family protein [Sterolibacteriaceae bacterium]|uniref:PRTRC system ParB family protein n=1 Tax=Candidatus Methylophosphatis roskildensis TaxID=2899263 RepID=A0A9D7E6P4_9PROT|nr:PRTRC system ParB family protein [Candidatus Methylophosphatis roskildensis]